MRPAGRSLPTLGIDISLLVKQIDIIHNHFVITTVDKASNNFAFTVLVKKFILVKLRGIRY